MVRVSLGVKAWTFSASRAFIISALYISSWRSYLKVILVGIFHRVLITSKGSCCSTGCLKVVRFKGATDSTVLGDLVGLFKICKGSTVSSNQLIFSLWQFPVTCSFSSHLAYLILRHSFQIWPFLLQLPHLVDILQSLAMCPSFWQLKQMNPCFALDLACYCCLFWGGW